MHGYHDSDLALTPASYPYHFVLAFGYGDKVPRKSPQKGMIYLAYGFRRFDSQPPGSIVSGPVVG